MTRVRYRPSGVREVSCSECPQHFQHPLGTEGRPRATCSAACARARTQRLRNAVEPATGKPPVRGYQQLCIAIYDQDLVALDALVSAAKRLGVRRASRSLLIRVAVAHFDLDAHRTQLDRTGPATR